jgi:hypothetical protein
VLVDLIAVFKQEVAALFCLLFIRLAGCYLAGWHLLGWLDVVRLPG